MARAKFMFILLMSIPYGNASAQFTISSDTIVSKTDELIKLQKKGGYYISGRANQRIVYQINKGQDSQMQAASKVYYDERAKKITDTTNLSQTEHKVHRFKQVGAVEIVSGLYNLPKELKNKTIDELSTAQNFYQHQDVWLKMDGVEFKLASYPEHLLEKDLEYSIDDSCNYALLSTFVSEYLRSIEADSIIKVIQINHKNIKESKVEEVYCLECIKPQIAGNYLYYGKKFFYISGSDVYDWKVYRAPLFDLSKSELIGEYIEMNLVAPDGKYILGKKMLHGKETFVILNVEQKKFQFLLGREYHKFQPFYSPGFRKFAFDSPDNIFYVDFPEKFSFNSVGMDATPKRFSKTDDAAFWEKFKSFPK